MGSACSVNRDLEGKGSTHHILWEVFSKIEFC